MELLKHKDYVRVLMALERKPMRFTELQKHLKLNPVQVDRALAFLRKGLWIIPKTAAAETGPIRVEYALGKRGAAFLEAFESFQDEAERRAPALGRSEVAELQALSR